MEQEFGNIPKTRVRVSDLAKLGVCEKQIKLRNLHGEKYTRYQEHRITEGNNAHTQHYKNVSRDKRCFIATVIYGEDAVQTCKLRLFRDEKLLNTKTGTIFVNIYYRLSPAIVLVLDKLPILRKPVKLVLDYMVKKL